jgi:hypothetical protein
MNLHDFNFPKVDAVDMAFPTFGADPALLAEARDRGFYHGHTPYNKLAFTLFFKGGKVQFRKDVPEEFRERAWAYVRAFMGSWAPKHEEKDAICALIISEICEPELQKDAA